ncbi:MAG: addiction module protein [Immundisolibacter sp.]|uniref:addiction module protein n=1 Tax=Immundisolibacter sp. TaxID=1934948 RepID=UPI0035664580
MVDAALLSRVKTMSPADRLELIGAVWETLSPADAPVTEEEKTLLDVRLADLENNPQDQSPWSEVRTRLRQQLP